MEGNKHLSYVCDFCLKEKGKENDTNWERHLSACKHKKEKKT